jgi:hypothetical protein
MYAFVNHRCSCFLDTVLVVMFLTSMKFDFILGDTTIPVVRALRDEVARLRTRNDRGWVVTQLRELMGPPWNDGHPQSAVDFFHALLDCVKVESLGKLKHVIAYVSKGADTHQDICTSDAEGFRVHLAVAGQHVSLEDVFEVQETMLPPEAESYATVSFMTLVAAPVLVFEVGRNANTDPVQYGITSGGEQARISIEVNLVEYTLVGVVCRVREHYMGFVWHPDGWGVYDDLVEGGAIFKCKHPEECPNAPSRFGELFFYVLGHHTK